jgi:hypothetical protein
MSPLELLPIPVLVTGPMGRVLSVNKSLLALISGNESDWLECSMDSFFPASCRILLHTHIWPLLLHEGRIQDVYLQIHDNNQNAIPVLVNCQRQSLNGSEAYYWVFAVMLERTRFKQELPSTRKEVPQSAPKLKR